MKKFALAFAEEIENPHFIRVVAVVEGALSSAPNVFITLLIVMYSLYTQSAGG